MKLKLPIWLSILILMAITGELSYSAGKHAADRYYLERPTLQINAPMPLWTYSAAIRISDKTDGIIIGKGWTLTCVDINTRSKLIAPVLDCIPSSISTTGETQVINNRITISSLMDGIIDESDNRVGIPLPFGGKGFVLGEK
jgi:hypothetical protein